MEGKTKITPYDAWTKRNLIFNKEQGLIADYPWITDEWVKKQIKGFYPPQNRWMIPNKLYYGFFLVQMQKTNIRMASGAELENSDFYVNTVFLSQNAMLAKLLELRAKQEELNRYVEELIGTGPKKILGSVPGMPESTDYYDPIRKFFDWFSLNFAFRKGGPYERDFEDRYTKFYAPGVMDKYRQITGFIKRKMGLGVA